MERVTLLAVLHSQALRSVPTGQYWYCATPDCRLVYFGAGTFEVGEVRPPVFHKEPFGHRTICYCLGIREDEVTGELKSSKGSPSIERIEGLVRERRCACHLRNPEGVCCLGNVRRLWRSRPAESAAESGTDPERACLLGGARTEVSR